MKKLVNIAVAALMAANAAPAALANDTHHTAAAASAEASATMSEGEVRKIDKDAGKITIKHGPLVNLGMPAMTMVFRVKDPVMLDQVKAGDKIAFVAEKAGSALTVTKLEVRH